MKSWVSSAFSDAPTIQSLPKKSNVNTRSLKAPNSNSDSTVKSTKSAIQIDSKNKLTELKTFLPLVERYKPKSRLELIVNKAKIDQLSQVLDNVINKKKGSIVILEGPSGCGKNVLNIFINLFL